MRVYSEIPSGVAVSDSGLPVRPLGSLTKQSLNLISLLAVSCLSLKPTACSGELACFGLMLLLVISLVE